jgi:C4-dicarboxylate transporter, DcuC family
MPDVRLVLIVLGVILAWLGGDVFTAFDEIQKALGKGEIIGPICTAMGYAWVLKYCGCDVAMVQRCIRPLRKISWALLPGGCLIGFCTNMAITSQTASAAAVGPILVPLMLAAGYRPVIAGATLLVGCSIGGNLFNPGEPDIVAIVAATGVPASQVLQAAIVPNLLSFAVATAVLWFVHVRTRTEHEHSFAIPNDASQYPWYFALFPPLPVLVLLALQPALGLIPPLVQRYPDGLHISTLMVVSMILVLLFCGPKSGRTAFLNKGIQEFFAGMGYAFTHVISLIIAALCFAGGLKSVGLIQSLSVLIAGYPNVAMVVSPILTMALAVLSGSGTAPSVAFSQAVLPSVVVHGSHQAIQLGIIGAIGASVGRTTSPVSAVMFFTCALVHQPPSALIRVVLWPMAASVLVTILWSLFGVR